MTTGSAGDTGMGQGEQRMHSAAGEAAQLVELRVTLAQQTAELGRLRTDLAQLIGMPMQLDALSRLWAEQLDNVKAHQKRDTAELRSDVDDLKAWQTWAMRLVIGAVVLTVLAVVVNANPPTP